MSTESREGPTNVEEGKEYKIPCIDCDRPTFHHVVRSAEYALKFDDGDFSILGWEEYQIVECKGCRTLTFRKANRNTENTYFDKHSGSEELSESVELFPSRQVGRAEIEGAWQLPAPIQRIYAETLSALRATLPVLAGIGIRALVESVCNDCKAGGANLEQRIDGLVTQGRLTSEGAEILHGLRLMGNQAAHEVKPHKVSDLNAAFDVIEYVLNCVYLIPKKAVGLPRRGAA